MSTTPLLRIEKFAQQRPEPELVYALAELSWIEGKRLDRWRKPQALDRYLDAAAYSFDFLFDPDPVLAQGRKPADPRYRQAMEIYNAGVDHLIRAAMTKEQIQPAERRGHPLQVPWPRAEAPVRPPGLPLAASADVHKLLLASDFEVSGLNTRLQPVRTGRAPDRRPRDRRHKGPARRRQEQFYPAEMAFPLTAFLVPNSRLQDPNVDAEEARVCTLS